PHPSPYGGLCEIELLGDPADALATLADELDHLCLVSLRESPSLLSLHGTLLPHFRAIRSVYRNGASSAARTTREGGSSPARPHASTERTRYSRRHSERMHARAVPTRGPPRPGARWPATATTVHPAASLRAAPPPRRSREFPRSGSGGSVPTRDDPRRESPPSPSARHGSRGRRRLRDPRPPRPGDRSGRSVAPP